MKIIYSAELRGIEGLFSQLFRLAVNWPAEAIIIGGDLLPKHGSWGAAVMFKLEDVLNTMNHTIFGSDLE